MSCTVPAGYPYAISWNYDSAHSSTYFTITLPDRTQWITTDLTTAPGFDWYPLGQIVDRNGNAILFNYTSPGSGFPLLTSIGDKNNLALLTINREANGGITSVADRYGRSIYYHIGSYVNTNGATWPEVDHVSQIVATGATNPPDRYAYAYTNVLNGDPNNATEAMPFLTGITVPSPTGTGTATATINYQPDTCYVTSLVDANGNTRSLTVVDQTHTKVTFTDKNNVVDYSYTVGFDQNMSGTTVTDGTNNTIILTRTFSDPNDPYRPSSTENGNNDVTSYVWDQYGNLHQKTSPRNTVTNYTWAFPTANSVVNSIIDTTLTFSLGELRQEQEGTKTPNKYTYYEPNGNLQTFSSPVPGSATGSNTWVQTNYTWSALGNLLSVKSPGNNATIINGVDQGTTITWNYTTDGSFTQAEALGQRLTFTDPAGEVTHFRYYNHQANANDPLVNTGEIKSNTDALGNEINTTYNIANQDVQTTYPATGQTGSGQSYTFAAYLYPEGPCTGLTFFNENQTQVRQKTMSYGGEGEMLAITGNEEPVAATYDALYRQVSLSDGNSHTTTFAYNTTGYLAQVSYPLANGAFDTLNFTSFDAAGNLLTRVDGRGITTKYVYNDPESLLTNIEYPATPGLNASFNYDAYGRRQTLNDGTGTASYSYDDLNSVTSATTTYTGLPSLTLNYSYYPDGSCQSMSTPAGSFNYSFDSVGRLTALTNPYHEQFGWTYLANGWLWKQQMQNSASTTVAGTVYTYNALQQITELSNQSGTNATLSDFHSLVYDAVWNRTSLTANIPSAPAYSGFTNCQYDNRDELTQEQSSRSGTYTNSFGYDGAGNPTTFRGVVQTFNSDNQNNVSTFDGAGNPTTYRGTALTYDPESQLTTYNGTTLQAGYTIDHRRAWKQTASGQTYFLYNGIVPVCELDANGNVTAVNTFGAYGLVARHTNSASVFYTFDPSGNAAQRLDSNGNVLGSYCFDAFGTRSSTDNSTDPYSGFSGQFGGYTDWETGLVLLGHRYYDSTTGRYLNRNLRGYSGGINLYGYTANNPLVRVDPGGCLMEFLPAVSCEEVMPKLAECAKEGGEMRGPGLGGDQPAPPSGPTPEQPTTQGGNTGGNTGGNSGGNKGTLFPPVGPIAPSNGRKQPTTGNPQQPQLPGLEDPCPAPAPAEPAPGEPEQRVKECEEICKKIKWKYGMHSSEYQQCMDRCFHGKR